VSRSHRRAPTKPQHFHRAAPLEATAPDGAARDGAAAWPRVSPAPRRARTEPLHQISPRASAARTAVAPIASAPVVPAPGTPAARSKAGLPRLSDHFAAKPTAAPVVPPRPRSLAMGTRDLNERAPLRGKPTVVVAKQAVAAARASAEVAVEAKPAVVAEAVEPKAPRPAAPPRKAAALIVPDPPADEPSVVVAVEALAPPPPPLPAFVAAAIESSPATVAVAASLPAAVVTKRAPTARPVRAASSPGWTATEDAFFGAGEAMERAPTEVETFDDLDAAAGQVELRGFFGRLLGGKRR
jgi:hypothetical protein